MSIKYRKFLTGSTKLLTTSPSQTKKVAEILAAAILKEKPGRRARVFGLVGDLGGGKTTFLQGFARGLGIEERILSPTFVILKRFQVPSTRFRNFYHIDCYRVQKPEELLGLGFKEIVHDPRNIVAVEWADQIEKIMPQETTWIDFEFIDNKTRKITTR